MQNPDLSYANATSRPALVRFIPLTTGLLSFVVYWLTLLPEVGPGDSAELTLQAYQLGVTHPPGYPVHSFLGKLFTFVCAEPAVATNLLSAVCAAVAVGLLSAIVLYLTGGWCAAMFAPLLFAFTPRVWEAAITTEVYTVNVCVLGLALMLVIKSLPRDCFPDGSDRLGSRSHRDLGMASERYRRCLPACWASHWVAAWLI